MMQVKKYRAATTREALEQIKMDLGEDAFVLETRRVKSGGFLGLGSHMQIEISAANPNNSLKNTVEKKSKAENGKINLTDDSIAQPLPITKKNKSSFTTALFNRNREIKKEVTDKKSLISSEIFPSAEKNKIETVEISTETPKIVHPKKEIVQANSSEQNTKPIAIVTENSGTLISNRELDLLRAELREVKFSLGTFSNRQNVQMTQSNVDLDMFGEVFDSPFYESYLQLISVGISPDIARNIISAVIPNFKKGLIHLDDLAKTALLQYLSTSLNFEPSPLEQNKSAILAVIGATGVGKTTTVAKIAARIALRERRRVELVTIDTYRIAAVEQLKIYAEIIGANCHVVRSVFELDAVLCRLPEDATVLVDTTGKNPHDLADQYELADYLKGREDIRKCLTIQSTMNLHDGLATIKKFGIYGADCLTLTKLDETTQPGAILELASKSGLPLSYLCSGQRVPEDIQIATAESFTSSILREQS